MTKGGKQRVNLKQHKTIENDILMDRLVEEFNKTPDIRYLSIISHLYIDYFLNEIIRLSFDESKLLLDETWGVGSFHNKLLILRALGIFAKKEKLVKNIELLGQIRNFYAHHLLISNKQPAEIKHKIKQLAYLDRIGNEKRYDVPWEEHVDEFKSRLHLSADSTIGVLQDIAWNLEKETRRLHTTPSDDSKRFVVHL